MSSPFDPPPGALSALEAQEPLIRQCSECGQWDDHKMDDDSWRCGGCGHVSVSNETYDAELAELAAEDGMDQARRAKRVQAWKAQADGWLSTKSWPYEFTADTLVKAIGLPDTLEDRERPNNVVGAYFSAKSKAKEIVWTGRFDRSKRVVGHGNQQRVWMVAR